MNKMMISVGVLTFTFESLLDDPPEEAAAVVTEGGAHVRVHLEPVGNVQFESFSQIL